MTEFDQRRYLTIGIGDMTQLAHLTFAPRPDGRILAQRERVYGAARHLLHGCVTRKFDEQRIATPALGTECGATTELRLDVAAPHEERAVQGDGTAVIGTARDRHDLNRTDRVIRIDDITKFELHLIQRTRDSRITEDIDIARHADIFIRHDVGRLRRAYAMLHDRTRFERRLR